MHQRDENKIIAIQGDTLDVTLTIDKPEDLEVKRVVFSCPAIKLEQDLDCLEDSNTLWHLLISSEDTKDFRVGRWEYNMTAITGDDQVYTVIFKGRFDVIYKRDKDLPEVEEDAKE